MSSMAWRGTLAPQTPGAATQCMSIGYCRVLSPSITQALGAFVLSPSIHGATISINMKNGSGIMEPLHTND